MIRRVACLTLLVALVACGGDGTPDASPTPSGRISSTAHLKFIQPVQGDRAPADHVQVKLELTGATLTKTVSTNITPNVGHVHLKLDGRTVSILAGLDEVLNDIADATTGRKIGPLTKGPHILTAEFVAADHAPFSPDVYVVVTITAV